MRRVHVILFTLLLAGAWTAPALAQERASPWSGTEGREGEARTLSAAERLAPAERLTPMPHSALLLSPGEAFDARATAPVAFVRERQVRNRRGIPLMVAGGILFVAGAIAGDDVGTLLILGGAGIGAWGAYVYFGGD